MLHPLVPWVAQGPSWIIYSNPGDLSQVASLWNSICDNPQGAAPSFFAHSFPPLHDIESSPFISLIALPCMTTNCKALSGNAPCTLPHPAAVMSFMLTSSSSSCVFKANGVGDAHCASVTCCSSSAREKESDIARTHRPY